MAKGDLEMIIELRESVVELLRVIGVESLAELSESEVEDLHAELTQANGYLSLQKENPTLDEVTSWVIKAQKLTGKELEAVVKEEVKEEGELVRLSSLPLALAVKKEQIIKGKIPVKAVPVMEKFAEESALVFDAEEREGVAAVRATTPRSEAPVEVKIEERRESSVKERASIQKVAEVPREEKEMVPEMALSGISAKKSDPLAQSERPEGEGKKRVVVEPLKRNEGFDIRKTASPKLNEGKKLHSRRYVRGVLHPQPGGVKVAALISLIAFLLFPASLVAAVLVIFREYFSFEVSFWILVIPAAFILFTLMYLVVAKPLKCRICGQPILASKGCNRHVKAHRIPLIGYIFPTSIHMLLFHWFRCIYCGTSVRLKE